ncbi:MAG: hypothetical protein NC321_01795 [Clostridium sp.]|nr:hypothetical protein [Clostridium sp.]
MLKIEVKEGLLPWVVGIGTIFIGIFLAVEAALHPDDSARVMLCIYLVILIMIGGGVLLCMDAKNRKMTVEDVNLCYTNSFGKKKNFTLADIGYCKAVMENKGAKEDICLYDIHGKKLCKLEFNMKDSLLFLQYLLDNQIKVECSPKSDRYLKNIICETSVCMEEIPDKVNQAYEEIKTLVSQWETGHKRFGVEWKTGITAYLQNDLSEKKQLWEEKAYTGQADFLLEGFLIGIEGYLQKDGQFVCDKKNRAVMFYVPLISVKKSWQIGEELKICFWGSGALEELSWQLEIWAERLPKNKYHTEDIILQHELKKEI